jgi:AcrR family transcriptional regulator
MRMKRANDPVGMRARVLDAAATAFQTRGYHATGIHDIARSAGVTGGALHHHFSTKKALGLAVIKERAAESMRQAWLNPITSAQTTIDGVVSAFDQIAATMESRGVVLGCPVNNLALELSLVDPDFQVAISGIFDEWRLAIAQKLRADRGRRLHNGLDADELAALIVASYSGAMAMAKAKQDIGLFKMCGRRLAHLLAGPKRK